MTLGEKWATLMDNKIAMWHNNHNLHSVLGSLVYSADVDLLESSVYKNISLAFLVFISWELKILKFNQYRSV